MSEEQDEEYDKVNSFDERSPKATDRKVRSKCGGCFSGLKDSRLARIHTFLFFLKRFLQCVVLFLMKDLDKGIKLGFFFGLEVIFFAAYLAIKPHKLVKDQLIEIITEIIYIILISRLFYFNDKDDWTTAEKVSFLSLIVLNFVLQTTISFSKVLLI